MHITGAFLTSVTLSAFAAAAGVDDATAVALRPELAVSWLV
jgi:hypothetical protein